MSACQIDSVLFLRSSCSFLETTFLKVDEIFDICYTDNCNEIWTRGERLKQYLFEWMRQA